MQGARGVVVFDGVGDERTSARSRCGSRRTPTRCSSASRPSTATRERVCLVSSDLAIRGISGLEVMKRSSADVLRDLGEVGPQLDATPSRLADRLDADTRARSSGCAAAAREQRTGRSRVQRNTLVICVVPAIFCST